MLKLFFDLDGTLAKFNSKRKALERFDKEKGFFANLKPFKYIEKVNELALRTDIEVYIISATPNSQADSDKMIWLEKYLNNIKKENICFCRLGKNKAKEIKEQLNIDINNECLLFDDYTNNLIDWNKSNGIGIKRLTSLANNKSKRWKGLSIRSLSSISGLVDKMVQEHQS